MKNLNRFSSPIRHAFVNEQGVLGFGWVGGVLLFVVLSGLAVWVLPFSVSAQMAVLLHTVLGLVLVAAFAIWQLSHWLATRKSPRRFRKISAYIGFWLLAVSSVAGLILTGQAVFGSYISPLWHQLHLWTGVLALPFLAYHVYPQAQENSDNLNQPAALPLMEQRPDHGPARRRMWKMATGTSAVLLLLLGVATVAYRAPAFGSYEPPAKYKAAYGKDPFTPSNAKTDSNRPLDPQLLANSDSCGTSGCHTVIYQEWLASAHRWSSEDQFFQTVRTVTTEVKGIHETEKCGGCHEPVSLLSGYKDPTLGKSSPGFKEGDSCVVCHAVSSYDERGIGSYVLRTPTPYLYEYSKARYATLLNHFLIRAYPEQHNRDYDLTIVRKPESCAPCHKEFDVIEKKQGPVEVEAQFDEWKHGKWNTDTNHANRLYCQQCHMYYADVQKKADADPYDLKVGLGLKHRNHYFSAANQYMPEMISAPDAAGQIHRVHQWLQGKHVVPEIDRTWPRGPVVPLKIVAPQIARPGEAVKLQIVLSNEKAGHNFPTGPINIVRAWIEVEVQDQTGRVVYHSGKLDAQNHVEAGSLILRPLVIDTKGHSIMEPDLWHPDGPQFRPSIPPGQTGTYDYEFHVPGAIQGPLIVKARLRYRKANQFFMDAAFPGEHLVTPVTDISSGQVEIATTRRRS